MVCEKCKTRYTASYYDRLCQRCKDEEAKRDDPLTDMIEGALIGYALGSLLSDAFSSDSSSSSSNSGSSSDWSGGGGDTGGGGASGDW